VKAVKCHGLIPSECLDHLVYRGSKGKDMEFQIEQAKDCVDRPMIEGPELITLDHSLCLYCMTTWSSVTVP